MKYAEYQVWYHVYISVATAISSAGEAFEQQEVINKADVIATHAVNKFKEVEDIPQTPNFDVQGIVDKVLKDANKKR